MLETPFYRFICLLHTYNKAYVNVELDSIMNLIDVKDSALYRFGGPLWFIKKMLPQLFSHLCVTLRDDCDFTYWLWVANILYLRSDSEVL